MAQETEPKITTIDMRGQVCPACLLVAMDNLNKHRKNLETGNESLCIKTDNRHAITTIPTTAQNMGYAVKVTKQDTYYTICISRSLLGENT